MLTLDFKTERSKDCILIDATKWVQNKSNMVQQYRLSGRDVITYIAEVLDTNLVNPEFKGKVKKGDYVLLSRVVSEVSQYRTYGIDGDNKYFNVPFMQIMGVFENRVISYNAFTPLFNKVLAVPFTPKKEGQFVEGITNKATIGKVLKTGRCRFNEAWEREPMKTSYGDTILIKDNMTTNIKLDGKDYYLLEEESIVCILDDLTYSLDDSEFINKSVLLQNYVPEKLLGSSILYTPNINYEDLDYTDIYNKNQMRVCHADLTLTQVKKNDIIFIDRNVASYVYYEDQKYYIVNGLDYVEGKLA